MTESQGDLSAKLHLVAGALGRRRWWALAPVFVFILGTAGVLERLPKRYRSEATLEIVQPAVSQRYVATDAISSSDVLDSVKREVLSRTRLLAIIDEFHLYAKRRQQMTPDALAEAMRKDVEVEPLDEVPDRREAGAFKVSFMAESASIAQAVTARLTSLFIESRLEREQGRAKMTTKFLEDELEQAKKQLAIQEQRRREFQMRYIGDLPSQQQASFSEVADLRAQLQNASNRAAQAEQQRAFLESQLSEKLARLRSERAALLARFTPRHPEVIQKDEAIAKMTTLLENMKEGAAESQAAPGLQAVDDPGLTSLLNQVRDNRMERANLGKEEARIRSEIAAYQGRLNLAPIHEQELAEILRDYDLHAQHVQALETQLLQARQATNLVERQEDQQFRLVDAPTLPVLPSSPSRSKVALGGLGLGVVVGIACAFLREMTAGVFQDEAALSQRFKVPLIVAIPLMPTQREQRMRWWRIGFELCAGCLLLLAAAAVEFSVMVGRHLP